MLALINPSNIRQVYKGFQSVPKVYQDSGLEIKMWNLNGSWHTPWYREEFKSGYYNTDRIYQIILLFPEDLNTQIGSRSLVIRMEVDIREEEGWVEEVVYTKGPKYKVHHTSSTQSEAEYFCQAGGGQLATVMTEHGGNKVLSENEDMKMLLSMTAVQEEFWTRRGIPQGNKLSGNSQELCQIVLRNELVPRSCTDYKSFICEAATNNVEEKFLNLEFTKEQLNFPSLQISYQYIFTSNQLIDSWENRRMTGFQLNWFLQDCNETKFAKKTLNLEPKIAVASFQEVSLVRMVQLAGQARLHNVSREEVVDKAIQEKVKLLQSGVLPYSTMCLGGQFIPKIIDFTFGQINFELEERNINEGFVTDDDITTGFMMFSAIVYCSKPVALSLFLHSLLSTQSPRTIIQATVNTIQSDINDQENRKSMNEFYLALDKILHFQFGRILLTTASPLQLEIMVDKNLPWVTMYSKDIDECLTGSICLGIMDLLHTSG